MCARCAVMCRMESCPRRVRSVQPPRTSLWNLNEKGASKEEPHPYRHEETLESLTAPACGWQGRQSSTLAPLPPESLAP